MIRLEDIRIRPKLLILFLITSITPLLVVGLLYSKWIEDAMVKESFSKLTTIQNLRKGQIENHFNKSFADIHLLADSERIYNFVGIMLSYEEKQETSSLDNLQAETEDFKKIVQNIKKPLQDYVTLNGYTDLYLIDADHGHVLFSVQGMADLGTNLSKGKMKSSALAKIWIRALETGKTVMTDFAPYSPANNQEMAFIADPVTNKAGEIIGVVVLRFGSELISQITESRKGMGETGESYLLGWHKDDNTFVLRSNMKTMGGGNYVVGFELGRNLDYWNDAAKAGSAGGHAVYRDSENNAVLVAFDKIDIKGLDWFLISKIDKYEVTHPIRMIYRQAGLVVFLLFIVIGLGAWLLSRGFTRPIIEDIKFAEAITQGELGSVLEVDRKDELGDLTKTLNTMSLNLYEVDWLKTGKEKLEDEIRGELEPDELAERCIRFFVKHLEANLGGVYLNNQGTLELRASYAFSDRKGNFNKFAFGEGMVGQAALEGELLFFTECKDDVPVVNYGAGEKTPGNFVLAPIVLEGDVIGVMLIGSVTPFTELHKKFIRQNIANSAIRFGAAHSRKKIAALLAEAKSQQEELRATNEELEDQTRALRESEAVLQSQQEELRVSNEELEEQTRALKESEAELQAQQEELRVTNEELEERTKALEEQKNEIWVKNSDLQEAQEAVEKKVKELEVASTYKSEFLANMSHELRTPLNSILILSQILSGNKSANLNEKQIESAQAIHSSGADLLNLINEILDLSKVEAGKIDLIIEDVLLERVVGDLQRIYKDVAGDKGLNLVFDVSSSITQSIKTDNQRLQQILRNLLTNAFKFTKEGTVSLKITQPNPEHIKGSSLNLEDSIAFSVRDQGIGIPEEKQRAIFEAFQQADGSTSRQFGGTGLGLSISKELARLLGGMIHLESEPGKGSTFTVIMPAEFLDKAIDTEDPPPSQITDTVIEQKAEQEPEKKVENNKQPETGIPTNSVVEDDRKIVTTGSKSLLIIEDDKNFSKILCDFAREKGFMCLIAEDGETGLHFADYYVPSAVILDIGLPGIDGWTVMERLKDNPKLRHIPVHFMSAADSSMDAMRMGAIGYLTKPVSMEKVEETFSKLENMISKPVSRLLVVEDDTLQRQSIKELIGNSDVQTTAVATGTEAYEELQQESYDCMILDLGLEDMSGFDLLEKIRKNEQLAKVPIIIYTGRELTEQEENRLNSYAESIIIKGVKSPERLLDESALFLHRVEANLPAEKRKMLKMVHDKEAVLSGRKILLVDDDMRNVFALSSILEERNLDVVVARDGVECLEKLQESPDVDAVLMDIMMPRMDGYDAMRHIRKDSKLKKLPIIALTAKAMKGDRSKCIEAGANDYLAKPVNPDKLLSMLRVWLYR